MNDQPFISFGAHATGFDVWYSVMHDRVTIYPQGTGAHMSLSVKDAQGLHEKLGIALRMSSLHKASAEDDGEERPEDPDAVRDRAIADKDGAL